MRNLDTSKAVGYNSFLKPEQYAEKHLTGDPQLPKRVDFHPQLALSRQPTEIEKQQVMDKSEKILEKVLLDGRPLTDLYDLEMQISSFNPAGYGADKWKYYLVASLKQDVASAKPSDIYKESLKMMVKEAIAELTSPGKIESLADGISSATIIGEKWSNMIINFEGVYDHVKSFERLYRAAKGKLPTDDVVRELDRIVASLEKMKSVIQTMDQFEQRDRRGLKEATMSTGEIWDPASFELLKPIQVWVITGPPAPTNAWYGNAQISESPTKKHILNPGDKLFWSPGGVFGQLKGKTDIFKVILFQPKSPFEKSYGNYTDLWFNRKVKDGELKLLSHNVPNLRYEDDVIFKG
jgi:hypothetical protein